MLIYINKQESKLLLASVESSYNPSLSFNTNSLEDLKKQANKFKIHHLKLWDADLFYYIELVPNNDNELIIKSTQYFIEHCDIAFIDKLFSLIISRGIEIIDKIGHKEFDHYLRLDQATPFFKHYPSELYQLLGITEEIKAKAIGKKVEKQKVFEQHLHSDFDLMSLSEKLELAEEIISELMSMVSLDAVDKIETDSVEGDVFNFVYRDLDSMQISDIESKITEEFDAKINCSFKKLSE